MTPETKHDLATHLGLGQGRERGTIVDVERKVGRGHERLLSQGPTGRPERFLQRRRERAHELSTRMEDGMGCQPALRVQTANDAARCRASVDVPLPNPAQPASHASMSRFGWSRSAGASPGSRWPRVKSSGATTAPFRRPSPSACPAAASKPLSRYSPTWPPRQPSAEAPF